MIDINQTLQKAVQLHTSGNLQDAEIAYREVLSQMPDHPDAVHFMGVLAYNVGRNDVAREYIQRAIELSPDNEACYNNMGNIFQKEEEYPEAILWYKKTIKMNPDHKMAHNNLGVAYTKTGKYEEAVSYLNRAVEIDPYYIEALNNLGETFKYIGEYEKSIEYCERALSIDPVCPQSRWNRSILWLLTGDFKQGWQEYEWRWKRPATPYRNVAAGKVWNGENLTGKTIFVYEEQGIGDTIQFVRYLPLIQKTGGKVIFETLPLLIRLFKEFQGFDRLWMGIQNVDTRPTDRFDYHIPLLSLPKLFNTVLDTIPKDTPYLRSDKDLTQIWEKRIVCENEFKIGVVWAGSPGHVNDRNRSCLLGKFKNLIQIENIKLFSLQKEKYEKWTDINPSEVFEQDLGVQISDFADTAAIIENLDLVISVDTAVVHLAGAMGKEVWTLLPFSPDWRWMIGRNDSPWYPTMRLFRQPGVGDWDSVFSEVNEALIKRAAYHN